jgi:hypothetical protein
VLLRRIFYWRTAFGPALLPSANFPDEVSWKLNGPCRHSSDGVSRLQAASLGPAVTDYLLEDNTPWGQAPPVKGLRDAVLELLYPLVAVHAEVRSGGVSSILFLFSLAALSCQVSLCLAVRADVRAP